MSITMQKYSRTASLAAGSDLSKFRAVLVSSTWFADFVATLDPERKFLNSCMRSWDAFAFDALAMVIKFVFGGSEEGFLSGHNISDENVNIQHFSRLAAVLEGVLR
jgi:hypothetical protein